MLDQDAPAMSSGLHGYVRRARERRRGHWHDEASTAAPQLYLSIPFGSRR